MPKLKPTTPADLSTLANDLGVSTSHRMVAFAACYLTYLRNLKVTQPLKEPFGLTIDEAAECKGAAAKVYAKERKK